jgi:ribose-phosphate pyrophosphokinase
MLVECELSLFAVERTRDYGLRVAQHLELVLDEHEERGFEDGEHKIRPLVNVRRHDVFVIHSLYGNAEQSANDKLCRRLVFISALKARSPHARSSAAPRVGRSHLVDRKGKTHHRRNTFLLPCDRRFDALQRPPAALMHINRGAGSSPEYIG